MTGDQRQGTASMPSHQDGRPGRGLRQSAEDAIGSVEIVCLVLLAFLLMVTAVATLFGAGAGLWTALIQHPHWNDLEEATDIAERLLFVLMLLEILHTVRLSIRHEHLILKPFLIVAVIAAIRRMLMLSLHSVNLKSPGAEGVLRASLWEIGVLGIIVIAIVVVIAVYGERLSLQEDEPASQPARRPYIPPTDPVDA